MRQVPTPVYQSRDKYVFKLHGVRTHHIPQKNIGLQYLYSSLPTNGYGTRLKLVMVV